MITILLLWHDDDDDDCSLGISVLIDYIVAISRHVHDTLLLMCIEWILSITWYASWYLRIECMRGTRLSQ